MHSCQPGCAVPSHGRPPGPVWLLHPPKNVLQPQDGLSLCTIWTRGPGAPCCDGLSAYLWPCSVLHGSMHRRTNLCGTSDERRGSGGAGPWKGHGLLHHSSAAMCTAFFAGRGEVDTGDAGREKPTEDALHAPRGREMGGASLDRAGVALSPFDFPGKWVGHQCRHSVGCVASLAGQAQVAGAPAPPLRWR